MTPIIDDRRLAGRRLRDDAALPPPTQDLPALGYVVSYRALQAALDAALARAGIAVRHGVTAISVGGTPAYAAVAIEGAEPVLARLAGGRRRHRRRGRGHRTAAPRLRAGRAWSRRCGAPTPHAGIAYERFTPEGPVALLPEGDHYGLVWTTTPARARGIAGARRRAHSSRRSTRHFGARTRRLHARRRPPRVSAGARIRAHDGRHALRRARQRRADAAPGRGTGLQRRPARRRGARAGRTRTRRATRSASARCSSATRAAAAADRWAGIAFTHGLVSVFGSDLALLRWPRGLALTLLDTLPRGEARVHARDAVRAALSDAASRAPRATRSVAANRAIRRANAARIISRSRRTARVAEPV